MRLAAVLRKGDCGGAEGGGAGEYDRVDRGCTYGYILWSWYTVYDGYRRHHGLGFDYIRPRSGIVDRDGHSPTYSACTFAPV